MIILQKIALVLTIIGAINWGLVGIFNFNLVEFFFNVNSIPTRIIYVAVAICALFNLGLFFINNHQDEILE